MWRGGDTGGRRCGFAETAATRDPRTMEGWGVCGGAGAGMGLAGAGCVRWAGR